MIEAYFRTDAGDFTCSDGTHVSQAVIVWTDEDDGLDARCGVSLTTENWRTTRTLTVKAMLDGYVDADVMRYLDIYEVNYFNGIKQKKYCVGTIEVNLHLPLKESENAYIHI